MGAMGSLVGASIGSKMGARFAPQIGAYAGRTVGQFADMGADFAKHLQGLTKPAVPYAPGKVNISAGKAADFFTGRREQLVNTATEVGTKYGPQIGAVVGARMLGGRKQQQQQRQAPRSYGYAPPDTLNYGA